MALIAHSAAQSMSFKYYKSEECIKRDNGLPSPSKWRILCPVHDTTVMKNNLRMAARLENISHAKAQRKLDR